MRKFGLLMSVFLLSGCNINNLISPSEKQYVSEFVMQADYGMIYEDKVTLLYDYSLFSYFDINEHINTNELIVGDVVKITSTSDFLILESYPGQIQLHDEWISDIEVIDAIEVNFTVNPVPGGGLDILCEDEKYRDYSLPEYIIYGDNNFTSIDNIYQFLQLKGTLTYNQQEQKILALYAIDYDSSKVE